MLNHDGAHREAASPVAGKRQFDAARWPRAFTVLMSTGVQSGRRVRPCASNGARDRERGLSVGSCGGCGPTKRARKRSRVKSGERFSGRKIEPGGARPYTSRGNDSYN